LIGNDEAKHSDTVVCRLSGQDSIGPSCVCDQSLDRISSTISLLPTSQFAAAGALVISVLLRPVRRLQPEEDRSASELGPADADGQRIHPRTLAGARPWTARS